MSTGSHWSDGRTINEVMAEQAPTYDGWICPDCENHEGDLNCKHGIFISVVGANMSGCWGFKPRTEGD
jgi:hypothetical protein